MPLVQRKLNFTFQLGTGSFGEGPADTVKLTGHRASVQITKSGVPSMHQANIRIFGVPASVMNQLSRIGVIPTAFRDNIVIVEAGTDPSNMAVAFAGGLQEAWPDYSSSPEVSFNVVGLTGLFANMKSVPPSSYTGPTDVAVIIERLAKQMGYTFENNGVSVILSRPYLPGTARVQAISAADQANIFIIFDDDRHVLAILPKDGSRQGEPTVLDAALGAIVNYPNYVGPGEIGLRALYNPSIRFYADILVKNSLIQGANGKWRVNSMNHNLESEMPDGAWFTDIRGNLLLGSVPSL